MTLDDFIASYDTFKKDPESRLNSIVKGIKIPLREDMGILVLTILEGMPFEITTQEAKKLVDTDIQKTLNTDFFVTVPLKAKDKVLGAILVDNIFNKKPITKSDVKIAQTFSNTHASFGLWTLDFGLADRLHNQPSSHVHGKSPKARMPKK